MRRFAIVVGAWLLALDASAQEPVSLDEVIRLVREESPAAHALASAAEVADAEVAVAGVYSNPTFSYVGMARFDGSSAAINGTQHQLWLDIPILVGQQDARRDAAAATARAVHADVDVALLGLEVEARRAYVQLMDAEARGARLQATSEALARLRTLLEARARAGAESEYDTARLEIAVAQAEARVGAARVDERRESVRLAALLGRPGWLPTASETLEDATFGEVSLDALPTVVAARRRLEAAERDIHRAEMERIPELSLGAGTYFTSDGDSGSAYFGLSSPLPIFDTGEAAVSRARAARGAASDALDAVIARARAATEGARQVLAQRRAALDAFDAATAERMERLVTMAESAYRLGASGIFELLDAFRARLDLELTHIELMTAALDAAIDVIAIGVE